MSLYRIQKDLKIVWLFLICHPIFMEPWLVRQDINVSTKSVQLLTQRLYNIINKDCIFHRIFAEPCLIYQDPILFTNILLVILSLRTLIFPSGFNANIVQVISGLVCKNPTKILFIILVQYCLSKDLPQSGIWLF